MEKHFVSEQEHILDGFRLGRKIVDAGFRPTIIVGLWRGGSAVGIVVQECLATLGIQTDHLALRTSYGGREEYERSYRAKAAIRVHGRQYLLENANAEDRLLIVDDVYSSGRHTQAVVDSLRSRLKRNTPQEIRIAAVWYRPNQADHRQQRPDFYVRETHDWLVLPYEMRGLTIAEINASKPFLRPLLERCKLGG